MVLEGRSQRNNFLSPLTHHLVRTQHTKLFETAEQPSWRETFVFVCTTNVWYNKLDIVHIVITFIALNIKITAVSMSPVCTFVRLVTREP